MFELSTQTEMTMSSREIAELTKKDHKNVLRVIRSLIDGQVLVAQIEPLKFEYRGQLFDYFELGKRDSLVVVARLSPEFTAAVVDRWQELEKKSQVSVPATFAEALQLAANQAKELEAKNQQLAIAAPKAEFADAVAGADKGVLLGQFAKTVGLGPIAIFRILRELKIFMSRGSSYNLPYQEFVERGYFTVKQGTYETNSETRISHTAMVTGKGEIWLRKKLIETGHLKAVAA
ncbi:DNA-binding protein [Vibrio parahaemolyticus]|uniref:phage antirepressor KilAC domain-containing protein n=1 Tax=Vibrio parahaemolyticus TaxID=670 RepID=UPI0003F9D2D8|nr:phage antirepressor KilAC domain-containing protein [Vibrio parahaemolyticus]EJB8451425.1 phage antirepressor KilAC domain-containing protein [Vibrio parahaemolyticus]MDG2639214.1 phage antirepressor KilAC domain-containing protein [Vibrio parahaemolyticus]OOQ68183.1 DNA-binding protein [Vibrio parahaemolyticus]PMT76234.1 DNA-binding protein [Vibrio parahaemolyticus]PMT81791.1 DNA-binding protein [Vibrio parahaemolyticus]